MKIRCIITDDEPIARKGLAGYIEKVPGLDLIGVCEDALQLKEFLQGNQVDLLFLDIEMPYLSGIDLIKSLENPPKVIFTTAYENYALQGFDLDIIDYLLKPISFERFLKAVKKAEDYFSTRGAPDTEYIFVKSEGKLEKVVFAEVLFIEALENYLAIYTNERKLITHATLKSMQQRLPSCFIQSHKSYLVNGNYVKAVEGNLLHVGDYKVPVSKYQKEAVFEKIINKSLLK